MRGGELDFFDNGHEKSAPGAFDYLDEPLELNLGGHEEFSLGTHGIGRIVRDDVVVRLEGGFHTSKRPVPVLGLVVVVQEENVGAINLSARDVNQLECVDVGLGEAFDVVVVGRTDNRGEGSLGLREEIFRILGGGHGSGDGGDEEGVQW